MRLSEIQKRRNMPEGAQTVPARRAIAWVIVGVVVAVGVYLFFRYAGSLAPLLD